MKITGWTNFETNKYEDVFGIPGNPRLTKKQEEEVENIIVAEMKNKGYKFNGIYHQQGDFGCPVIDNKYIYAVSMRKWGNLMAKVCDLPDDDKLAYVTWAWSTPVGVTPVYPEG